MQYYYIQNNLSITKEKPLPFLFVKKREIKSRLIRIDKKMLRLCKDSLFPRGREGILSNADELEQT